MRQQPSMVGNIQQTSTIPRPVSYNNINSPGMQSRDIHNTNLHMQPTTNLQTTNMQYTNLQTTNRQHTNMQNTNLGQHPGRQYPSSSGSGAGVTSPPRPAPSSGETVSRGVYGGSPGSRGFYGRRERDGSDVEV